MYIYDAEGSPIGMQYRASSYAENVFDYYFFEKNLQGDIVAVYGSNGTKYVEYSYDAWGNFTTTYYNGGASTGAAKNPFTYRGYYYDADLGLYYLNSRYYDSNVRRFISPDTVEVLNATPMSLTDKNLYAYCDNNPITRVDNGGEFWNFIVGAVVGAFVGAAVAIANGEDLAGVITSTVSGAASGFVASTGLGVVAQIGISTAIETATDVVNQVIDIAQSDGEKKYDFKQTLNEAALSFGTSVAGTAIGNFVDKNITKNLSKSKQMYKRYESKISLATTRKSIGKSSSALFRQSDKYLNKSTYYKNWYQGTSSFIGSITSLWKIAR